MSESPQAGEIQILGGYRLTPDHLQGLVEKQDMQPIEWRGERYEGYQMDSYRFAINRWLHKNSDKETNEPPKLVQIDPSTVIFPGAEWIGKLPDNPEQWDAVKKYLTASQNSPPAKYVQDKLREGDERLADLEWGIYVNPTLYDIPGITSATVGQNWVSQDKNPLLKLSY